jgi:hypothetical protein
MNALIWKEWRENRLIVLCAMLLPAVISAAYAAGLRAFGDRAQAVNSGDIYAIMAFIWAVAAILCGSSLVAPEVNSGTLQLLSVLPVSRGRIWWTKIVCGLGLFLLCSVAAVVSTLIFVSIALPMNVFGSEGGFSGLSESCVAWPYALPLFAVASVMTMVLDRTISAMMASIIVSVAVAGLLAWIASGWQLVSGAYNPTVIPVILVLFVAGFLRISYKVFVAGETLRTSKRFWILGSFLIPPTVILAALVVAWLIVMA